MTKMTKMTMVTMKDTMRKELMLQMIRDEIAWKVEKMGQAGKDMDWVQQYAESVEVNVG